MKVWGWLAVALHGMLAVAFAAAPVNETASSREMAVAELVKNANGMSVRLELGAPTWETVETDQGPVFRAGYSDAGMISEEGEPAVPYASRFFRLPATGGVSVEVTDVEYETLTDVDYALYLEEAEVPVFGKNSEPVDAWFPENIVSVTEPAIMRDFRVSMLQTYPVQVNPARREARVYSSINVEMNYTQEDAPNELEYWPTKLSENFIDYYRDFIDWGENEVDDYVIYRGAVQVVTRTSALSTLQPWLDWKRQKGWEIDLLTEDDCSMTSTAIKQELQSRFNAAETKFDFVVIVGDAATPYNIPAAGGNGDRDYARLIGTDYLVDVAVGRISVESESQLVGYVNKVLFYEKTPYMGDTSWYLRGMVAAGSASSGTSTILIGRYARHLMLGLGYTQVDTAWWNDGQGPVNPRCSNALNNGVSFYNYRGWLNTGLGVSGINALNNSFKIPFVIDVTCGTGNWVGSSTGYNEAWMRAGTPTVPKGGIGAISTATSSTHTRPNNAIAGGAINSVLNLRNPNMGMAWYGALSNLYRNLSPGAMDYVIDFTEWNNLMGDPTVWLWTDIPHTMTLSAASTFQLGQNGYSVTVMEDGSPVEGAWVTLYKSDGNEEVIAHGLSDSNGWISLDAPFRYEGDAVLTVTKQNFQPGIVDVDVVTGDRVGYISYAIVDDGSNGTDGNNNGIAEAGETVGLRFTAKNYGSSSHSDVTATMSSDDPNIASVTGTAEFGTIAAGGEAVATSVILVEIEGTMQNEWICNFDLTFNSGATNWSDEVNLEMTAPKFALVSANLIGSLDPGMSATMNVNIRNIGGSIATEGTASLYSLDSFFGVETVGVTLSTTTPEQNTTVGPFTVYSHPEAFSGYPARYMLVLTTNTGQADTIYSQMALGTRQSTDPVGPDRYGYIAYENTDTDYDLAPDYDWVEINPSAGGSDFNGTRIASINDAAEEDDDTEVVNLPFEVQYYGETFTQATIAGNGYIAMGAQGDMNNARNWPIPSPLGPNYMIAPYWDDRHVNNGAGVYTYYDQPNGRYIVEWYQVTDYDSGAPCTFQVIFYDQVEGHITFSGDNEFLFQYGAVTHTQGHQGYGNPDVPYFTLGIENGDQTDGLMLNYWQIAQAGASPVQQGRSILFTTQMALITGTVAGRVTAAADDWPMAGVTVHTSDWIYQTVTDDNGDYVLEDVAIGRHHIVASGSCINTITVENVQVSEDQTSTVNFEATVPQFAVDTDEIVETIGQNETRVVSLGLSNDGDGPTTFEVSVDFWGPEGAAQYVGNDPRGPVAGTDELDEMWELLAAFDVDLAVEPRNRGITHDEEFYWVSGSDNLNATGPNKIYQYSNQGELIATFDQPVENPGVVGFYGLTWDGTYLYGSEEHVLYQMEFNGSSLTVVDSWDVPVNPARYLAYDSVNDLFWMGDYSTPLFGVDRSGNVQFEYNYDFQIAALGFFEADMDGNYLYAISRDPGDETVSVHRINPMSGNDVFATHLPANGNQIKDVEITYYWNPMRWTVTALFDGLANPDHVMIWELAENSAWMELSAESGTIPAGGSMSLDVTLRGLDLPDGAYGAWLRFDHHSCTEVTYIPVDINVDSDVETNTEQPLEWAFDGAYPNPFNPTTTIKFSLKEGAHVNARLFNVMGQEVAKIQNGYMNAGQHNVVVNGSHLASGVYFMTFEAGPLTATRKLVLLK